VRICVVGIGYVGLVTAACLAEAGSEVVCVDNDERKIAGLENDVIPIYEPGLVELVKHNRELGRLHFTTDLVIGIRKSLIIFLAVGTPPLADGSADMSAVFSVVTKIAENLTDYRIIVSKSTVPVGTHKKITELVRSKTNVSFDYVSNPEFLKEGSAVEDFMSPDRIIIGTTNPAVQETMKHLYDPFMRRSNRILFMDPASAEMTKYAANVMLATRISFINEIAALCEKVGADVEMVRRGVGSDSRIGPAFLFPGPGFGGSCLPKDVRALIQIGSAHGLEMTLTKAAQQVNSNQQERFIKRVTDYFHGRQNQITLAVWGLAFKAKTDDVRESPAINCIKRFLACGMRIKAYDPQANNAATAALDNKIETFTNGYAALDNADALVIFTDWQEFRNPDFDAIAAKLKKPVIFDSRNLYDPAYIKNYGFEYYNIGRA